MICNWFLKNSSYQENIHFPLYSYMFVRSIIEWKKSYENVACLLLAMELQQLWSYSLTQFDFGCASFKKFWFSVQKNLEVDCKIRLFICLFLFFGFVLFHCQKKICKCALFHARFSCGISDHTFAYWLMKWQSLSWIGWCHLGSSLW